MSEIKLHVGYVGKTRDGKRVEILRHWADDDTFRGSDAKWYHSNGNILQGNGGNQDIIGPWVDEPAAPAPDYNDGKWHGWNGGECPVHPKTVVSGIEDTVVKWTGPANHNDWPTFHGAFRVVTPYVEPPKPREFWLKLTKTGQGIPAIYDHFAGGAIHVREVLE